MIIVEGPDGAGKTTLISQMVERYDLQVAPRVVSKDANAMVNLRDWVDTNLEEGPQWMIFDRHRLISETIYGPALRQNAEDGFDSLTQMWLWLRKFYELEPLIIYCIPPLDVVKSNTEHDPDNRAVAHKIEAIYQAYVARAALDSIMSPGSVIIWDYTTDGQEQTPLLMLDGHIATMKTRIHA